MTTKNFTQFSTATPLTTGDYIVGYKEDGSAELKTTVLDIINLVQDSDNQTLSFDENFKNLSITSGNTVSLSTFATNTDFDSYKTTVGSATATLVKTTDFDSYKTEVSSATATLVKTTDFDSYKTEVSSATATLVKTTDFDSYKTNVASATSTLVLNTDFDSYKTEVSSATATLVKTTDFDSYKTTVASATATLLPTTVYQSTSGSFATTNFVQNNFLSLTGGTVNGTTNLVGTVSSINTPYYIVGTQPGYGINLLNRANFDPGTPLLVDGRGRVVHGMTFQAGITNFTNNSDHTHVLWASQNRQSWQMIQNGGTSSTNRNTFLLNTVGFNASQTGFNEDNIHSVDTRNTVVGGTFPNIADYVYINFNTDATPRLSAQQYVSVTFNPGMAGIVANTYAGTVSAGPITVTVDGNTKYQYVFSLELTNSVNWNNASKNIENVYVNSAGVKSCRVLTLPGAITGTYQGLSGNYLNIPRYVLVGIQNHNAYEGETVVLRIATNAKIGLNPASYNGYVKQVLNSNTFVISVGNAINGWYNTTGTYSLSDDWVVYKGSTDAIHQYTPALQHFYFQRFQTSDTSATTTGGNRTVALGNSVDIDGDFSYGLGHNASVFANHAAVFGGEDGLVKADYSTVVGGIGLVASGTNQFITGKYNQIYNTANKPFMVGFGNSDTDRKNILELTSDGSLNGTNLSVNGQISANNTIYDATGNSAQWNQAYNVATTYQSTSGSFIQTVTTTSPGISAVTTIVAVSALPVVQQPGVLYIVV